MPGPLVYFQLLTPNPAATQAFFAELFDWKLGDALPAQGSIITIDPQGPPTSTSKARSSPWRRRRRPA